MSRRPKLPLPPVQEGFMTVLLSAAEVVATIIQAGILGLIILGAVTVVGAGIRDLFRKEKP